MKERRNYRKNYSFAELAEYFELPLHVAAEMLDMSVSKLKRTCRECGITRWPYRRVMFFLLIPSLYFIRFKAFKIKF